MISGINSIRSIGAYSLINVTKYGIILAILAILEILTVDIGDNLLTLS